MGFNGVQKHQKIEDPRCLYWADIVGLLVGKKCRVRTALRHATCGPRQAPNDSLRQVQSSTLDTNT
jgi:hypothetical protein